MQRVGAFRILSWGCSLKSSSSRHGWPWRLVLKRWRLGSPWLEKPPFGCIWGSENRTWPIFHDHGPWNIGKTTIPTLRIFWASIFSDKPIWGSIWISLSTNFVLCFGLFLVSTVDANSVLSWVMKLCMSATKDRIRGNFSIPFLVRSHISLKADFSWKLQIWTYGGFLK